MGVAKRKDTQEGGKQSKADKEKKSRWKQNRSTNNA